MEKWQANIDTRLAIIENNTEIIKENMPTCEKLVLKEKIKFHGYLIAALFGGIIGIIFTVIEKFVTKT